MLKFLKISVLIICILPVVIAYSYYPVIELDYKYGNERALGRTGILVPLTYSNQKLFYTNVFMMGDTNKAFEGNFGVGYRHKIAEAWFVGGYGFWDIRRTTYKNNIHQATFGLEFSGDYTDFRTNFYIPQSKTFSINKIKNTRIDNSFVNQQTIRSTRQEEYVETILGGFDIEIGGTVPKFDRYSAFIAGYYFSKNSERVKGFRFRNTNRIFYWLTQENEIGYDNARKLVWYISIKLQYAFTNKKPSSISRLDLKMNQLPIRDIDIITTDTGTALTNPEIEVFDEYLPLIINKQEREKNNIIVTGDASFENISQLKKARKKIGASVEDVTLIDDNGQIVKVSQSSQAKSKYEKIFLEDIAKIDSNAETLLVAKSTQLNADSEEIIISDKIEDSDFIGGPLGIKLSKIEPEDKLSTLKIMMAIKQEDEALFRKLLLEMNINYLNRKVTLFNKGASAANYTIPEINQFRDFCQNELGISNADFSKMVNNDPTGFFNEFTRLWNEDNTPLTYALTTERMGFAEELLKVRKVNPRIKNHYQFDGLTMLYYGINNNKHGVLTAGKANLTDAEIAIKGQHCQNILSALESYYSTVEYRNIVNTPDFNGRTAMVRMFDGGTPKQGFYPFVRTSINKGLSAQVPTGRDPFWKETNGDGGEIKEALKFLKAVNLPRAILIKKSDGQGIMHVYTNAGGNTLISDEFIDFTTNNSINNIDVRPLFDIYAANKPIHSAINHDKFAPSPSNKALDIVKMMQAYGIKKASILPRFGNTIDQFFDNAINSTQVVNNTTPKGVNLQQARDLLDTLI
ncbi:MAG: inverse autotransporter beta domain-containing protein [Legionellales bacterium]|nr:inverse autotransporter beta domain-containing protein [Legionellales bacterium]